MFQMRLDVPQLPTGSDALPAAVEVGLDTPLLEPGGICCRVGGDRRGVRSEMISELTHVANRIPIREDSHLLLTFGSDIVAESTSIMQGESERNTLGLASLRRLLRNY